MPTAANAARVVSLVAVTAFLAAEPAFAGMVPVPGPLLAAGAPALAVFGAGYYLIRNYRSR